ncbi:hypothetical protein [Corynebacterium hylobatis]|uniref:hypothetical protein n=1 Tax=Corynebacterium hylobatis TaxID=1859290 RepID=UPI001F4A010B|nr:hypothetical protein [Corynebacterium hylobatis]
MKAGRLTALAALTASTLLLTACGGGPTEDVPDMGNAVAEVSPPATDPAGRVIELAAGHAEVTDMETAGDVIGLRSGGTLALGTLGQFEIGAVTEVTIPENCGDLTASADTFVLACREEVLLVDAASGDTERRSIAGTDAAPSIAATLTSTGELIVAGAEDDRVLVFEEGSGEPVETITVAGHTSQLIAVPREGQDDAVVRTNHVNTTIQDIHWRDGEQGGTLRIGLGVGRIAAGENGLLVASDNMGSQLTIYTANDVVRLHQAAPVDPSPWAVAWDAGRDLAWITSTAENTLAAYDVSSGVPERRASLDTVADAQSLLVLEDGTLVLASATGDGLQIIDNPDITSQ